MARRRLASHVSAVAAVALAAACWAVSPAAAQGMPSIFASNMVLQAAPLVARLFGYVEPGQTISATVTTTSGGPANPRTYNATADSSGIWQIPLEPVAASMDYVYSVEVANVDAGTSVVFTNVLFGDVWLCSGQSNMEMTMPMSYNADAEIEDSVNYPNIRVFSVQRNPQDAPVTNVGFRSGVAWASASPASLRGGDYDYFSAACYFFGRELQRVLNIPIGLVSSAYGGTIVEAWSSPDALAKCNATLGTARHRLLAAEDTKGMPEAWLDEPRGATAGPNDPSALWNGMIYPFINVTFRGATWYQGESNADDPEAYACLFPAMIEDWRVKMQQPDFGFYFVQLAPYQGGHLLADLRQVQTDSEGPLQRMAVAIDLWDPSSPYGEIHPRGKAPVGVRLALQALATTYGRNIDAAGPIASEAVLGTNGRSIEVVLTSRHPSQYKLTAIYDCTLDCAGAFHVANSVGVWINALSAEIVGNRVIVVPDPTVDVPTGVRFEWMDIPLCTIYDERGLPIRPFSLAL